MREPCFLPSNYISSLSRQFELKLSDLYSDISDADLDTAVVDAIRGNSQIGPNDVRSRLVSNGIKVQRHRVRDSMLRVDPDGSSQRSLPGLLKRRTYSVAGPNSVWHLDGNHKLIRYSHIKYAVTKNYRKPIRISNWTLSMFCHMDPTPALYF